MFNEEWELLTEPLLLNPLSSVCCSGIACEDDSLAEKRNQFWKDFSQTYPSEPNTTISELEGHVRDKKVTDLDFENKEAVTAVFESRNKHLNLYYTRDIFETLHDVF